MAEILHDRYHLIKKLGSGGTGEVYKAHDLRLKRKVAIKRVIPEKRNRPSAVDRLHKEAEYLARVSHTNVVMVHDIIDAPGAFCIVMELVQGQPFIRTFRKRPMPQLEFVGYFRQLLAALEAVHDVGLIHRDVNPRNVLVTHEGVVKLTDFGLSGFVHDAELRMGGTLAYMSPESMRKRGRLGFGVDIYSLGFMAYQAILSLQGFKKLYGATKPKDWIRWVLSSEPFVSLKSLGAPVSEGFSEIIAKMLHKDATQRYQKVKQVRADLEQWLNEEFGDDKDESGVEAASSGAGRGGLFGAMLRAKTLFGGRGSMGTIGESDTSEGSPSGLLKEDPSESAG